MPCATITDSDENLRKRIREPYLACDEAFDRDPDDPRLNDLAGAVVSYGRVGAPESSRSMDDPATIALLGAQSGSSPAWGRLGALRAAKAAGRW